MNKRILKEIEKASKSDLYKFIIDDLPTTPETSTNMQKYSIKFVVKEGLYKDQEHTIDIKFIYGTNNSKIYPEYPPLLTFTSSILHPNISVNGMVCVDVLSSKWSPLMSLDSVFNMVLLLLDEPNPDSPLNSAASDVFKLPLPERRCVIYEYYKENN